MLMISYLCYNIIDHVRPHKDLVLSYIRIYFREEAIYIRMTDSAKKGEKTRDAYRSVERHFDRWLKSNSFFVSSCYRAHKQHCLFFHFEFCFNMILLFSLAQVVFFYYEVVLKYTNLFSATHSVSVKCNLYFLNSSTYTRKSTAFFCLGNSVPVFLQRNWKTYLKVSKFSEKKINM